MGLAQFAGLTVAQAAITDMWEAVRGRFARLIGRGDASRTQTAERWLTQTHDQLAAAAGPELEEARRAQADRWAGRFADLLDLDPGVEAELRALAQEVSAQLPAPAVSAADHSVAAGRDVHAAIADRGGVIAQTVNGNVTLPDPPPPGSARR